MGSLLSMQTKAAKRWIDRGIIALMAVLGVFMLLPFAWLFSMSFRPPENPIGCPQASCRRLSILRTTGPSSFQCPVSCRSTGTASKSPFS